MILAALLQTVILYIWKCQGNVQAPQFIEEQSSWGSVVSENQTKILQCQALGYPQPTFRWLKDGELLSDFSSESFYKILSVSREDAGDYRCIARNSAGAIMSAKISVSVAYMSSINETEETELRLPAGEAAILPLPEIDSYPSPSVTWFAEDNSDLHGIKYARNVPDESLIILEAEPADSKIYRAKITNAQLGKEIWSPSIRLIVEGESEEEIAPTIIIPPSNITVTKGSSIAQLQCVANARSLWNLETTWFKDDIPIHEAGILYSFYGLWNRTLSLFSVDLRYAGEYKCQVRLKTSIDPPLVATAIVSIHEQPVVKEKLPSRTYADLGKTLTITCPVTGVPLPFIEWFRDGVNIQDYDNIRYRVLLNGSLAVSSVQVSDTGMFQCLASSPAGEAVAYTWLRVKTSPPELITAPENLTVLDGHDATLACHAKGSPQPNVTWFFNGKQELVGNGHYKILPTGYLVISSVSSGDAGEYLCVRSNEAGSVMGKGHVSILVKTRISQPPTDTQAILGQVAMFYCKISHAPSVSYHVSWYHDGNFINPNVSHRISIENDGTLEIQEVRSADVGLYACVVTSPGGNETRTARLKVIELPYAPINVLTERMRAISKTVKVSWTPAYDGNSAVIKYIVQRREVPVTGAVPDFSVNWKTVLKNVSASSLSAVVGDLRPSTGYQFRVSAVNSVGEGSPSDPSNTVVLPQEAPSGPPQGLVGSPRSSTEIMIQWEPPLEDDRNGIIKGYIVRYRLSGYKESHWYYRNITKELQHNYLIGGLIVWKDYEIQVAAYNVKGVGTYSKSIRKKTKEGVPTAPPKNVEAVSVSSASILVTWSQPDPWMINGINQGYKVQAWNVHPTNASEPSRTLTVPPSHYPDSNENGTVTGLEKFTSYYITVLCFTNPGDGNRSLPILVTTLEDVPGVVTDVKFKDISDRTVMVLWSSPKKQNGILKGYTVSYMVKDQPQTVVHQNLTADVTSLDISNLTAATFYTFEVYAWTNIGHGKPIKTTIQSGVEPILPDAPTRLAVSNIQPFSVLLQFTPGFDGNSTIIEWSVQANVSSRDMTWETIYSASAPDATTITVKNLVPYTNYRLRLTARNIVGNSAPSDPSPVFQTLQAEPAHPPSNMSVRAMSSTELRVRWIPLQPFEWYGASRGYRIQYKPHNCNCSYSEDYVHGTSANSYLLTGLQEFTLYEVTMVAVNDVGISISAPVSMERTRESVPSMGPSNVTANATSSTTIVVHWKQVPEMHQNGLIEGYKVVYGGKHIDPQEKVISGNTTFATTLTELKKYFIYAIQVSAFTRLGDGALSSPPLLVQTFEDVPGPPSSVSFPDVSFTYARIIWDVPEEPNGEIIEYFVSYHLADNTDFNTTHEFGPNVRTYRATELKPESYYLFLVCAKTRLGWGKALRAPVYTTNQRKLPMPPSKPVISFSQVTSTSVTFSWSPGQDGAAPIRYYTVQFLEGGTWQDIKETVDYSSSIYIARDLKPYVFYKFRLKATNDIGSSGWSEESEEVRTLPAAPIEPPTDIKVIPITQTSVRVKWIPLFPSSWSGDNSTGGYKVKYRQISDIQTAFSTQSKEVKGTLTRTAVLTDLQRDTNYEVVVVSFNSQGESDPSPPLTVYVGEAVPTGEPKNVKAEPVSYMEIKMTWNPPAEEDQNGEVLGYKIFYRSDQDPEASEEIEVVGPKSTSHDLLYLDAYTNYVITILCFNPAGDGPRSSPLYVRTLQTLPGPVVNLTFSDITMNSLKVTWHLPKSPNGPITGFLVTYETAKPNENFSKQVKQKVSTTYIFVQSLEEEVTYEFSVRAQTVIGDGPEVKENVTTGPQPGSPAQPRDLTLIKTISSVTLHWRNSHHGRASIQGYYIEAMKTESNKWDVLVKTEEGIEEEHTVSYQNLLPSTRYIFRLIAYNKYGISYPANSSDEVVTPSKIFLQYGFLQQPPFYHRTWFMVTLAAISVVIIIIIIATLCVKSKTYKYKQEAANKTMEESLSAEDGNLSFELQNHRGTLSKRGTMTRNTLGRHSMAGTSTAITSTKSPPRPAPSSVTYSDEDTVKGYDDNTDSSSDITEKPSETSTTDPGASDSEPESAHSEPHPIVNHYVNVDSHRQSWRKQKQAAMRHYSSYTDSEVDGSGIMSLNGGQVAMNNRARSRVPIAGYSSFV